MRLRGLLVSRRSLLTNNPRKRIGLAGYGLDLVEQTSIELPEGVRENLSQIAADRLTPLLMELIDAKA